MDEPWVILYSEDVANVLDPLLPSLVLSLSECSRNEVLLLLLDIQHPLLNTGTKETNM